MFYFLLTANLEVGKIVVLQKYRILLLQSLFFQKSVFHRNPYIW